MLAANVSANASPVSSTVPDASFPSSVASGIVRFRLPPRTPNTPRGGDLNMVFGGVMGRATARGKSGSIRTVVGGFEDAEDEEEEEEEEDEDDELEDDAAQGNEEQEEEEEEEEELASRAKSHETEERREWGATT